MKLIYATSINYPSNLTNRIQIIQMAKEFSNKLGNDFVLGGSDIKSENLNVTNFSGSRKSFILSFKYLRFIKENNFTHIFCREEKLLFFIIFYNKLFFRLPIKIVYEAHDFKGKGWWYLHLLKKVNNIITITQKLKEKLSSYTKVEIRVLSDSVDIEEFDLDISKEEARSEIGLSNDIKIALFIGSLYDWKGADTFVKASKFLKDINFVLIGGKKHHVDKFKKDFEDANNDNVQMFVRIEHNKMPMWLKSADVLVLPNNKGEDISELYTSPLKLFEYMAARRPIIASDLPSIREVLNETNSLLFEPNSDKSLADKIEVALNLNSDEITNKAYDDVKDNTWSNRVDKVIEFVK